MMWLKNYLLMTLVYTSYEKLCEGIKLKTLYIEELITIFTTFNSD